MNSLFVFSVFVVFGVYSSNADQFSVIKMPEFNVTGSLAAFGDFNADKMVDIFVIDDGGKQLDIFLAHPNRKFERKNLLNVTNGINDQLISGVILADFNGDLNMDILIVLKADKKTLLEIYWGKREGENVILHDVPYAFNTSFADEPVLFDYNGDMLPDLLVETTDVRYRNVWLASRSGNFTLAFNETATKPLQVPNSCAFISAGNRKNADLVLTVVDGVYEVYESGNVSISPSFNYSNPDQSPLLSSFGDFNRDGYIDHIIPSCSEDLCNISVYEFTNTSWYQMAQFKTLNVGTFKSDLLVFPSKLHVGDYDMDGYPDAVAVMATSDGKTKAVLFHNKPCDEPCPGTGNNEVNCAGYGRKFCPDGAALPAPSNSTLLATFFDIDEDGTLDVLMTVTSRNNSWPSQTIHKVVFIENNLASDTCFLKVTVVSGLCDVNDKCDKLWYGINVPGPTVDYSTTTTDGRPQKCAAGQLSQSCHHALQLPYVIFGLGQTPNFVDRVGVSIPLNNTSKSSRSRDWQQIIPNSQLIVNPSPVDEPTGWKMKLFVMPSKGVWLTGIALAATCGLLALIVGVLHLQERREDKMEKKQDSQKFHFDAM